MSVRVEHGDSRDVLRTLADASIDSVVTDPPYALVSIVKRFGKPGSAPAQEGADGRYRRASAGFMGKQWDTGETAFDPAFWSEVLRVMKPGAHLIAFGGTRTYHRLACAIEDAGFEIRDQLGWLYGSGFPKSHDVSKGIDKMQGDDPVTDDARQWQGWGTALKPAWEPIVLARKPLDGTVAANVLRHGTGALNIDGCRVPVSDAAYARNCSGDRGHADNRKREMDFGMTAGSANDAGRWPANVIHDGSEEVLQAFPDAGGQQRAVGPANGAKTSVNVYGDYGPRDQFEPRNDSGSAARFFYSAKADATDRLGSKHPTVKPVDLMAYLCRLVTPPGGIVLDPFAGSGTTGMACMREGFDCILIEREREYYNDILKRLDHVRGADTPLFAQDDYDAAADFSRSYDLACSEMHKRIKGAAE